MKENMAQGKETPPIPKRGMPDFLKGFLVTAIPATVFSLICVVGYHVSGGGEWNGFMFLWLAGPVIFLISIIVGFIKYKDQVVRAGLVAGITMSFAALGLSCFAVQP